jgi:uncharacterized repeat protein (TIGR01451 family)
MTWRTAVAATSVLILGWAGWQAFATPEPPGLLPKNSGMSTNVVKPRSEPGPRQEPSVRIEWSGPPTVRVGQVNEFTLCVRNLFQHPVENVCVRTRGPIVSADPKPATSADELCWHLGTLEPKQEKQVQIRLVIHHKGESLYPAWVTFTSQACLRVKASEPKLAVAVSGIGQCNLGDGAHWQVTVQNSGDGPAEQVRLQVELPEGIDHARGKVLNYELGNLQAGETRDVQVIGQARVGGNHMITARATADGDLAAKASAVVSVVAPRLDVAIDGPKLRYLDRRATYTVKVTNPGDAPAANVLVHDVLPAGFKFIAADQGGRFDSATRTVSWFVGEIPPGESREVIVELQANNTGEFQHAVTAQAARGLRAETRLPTRVEGLSAIQLEVVDTQDPVEVGGETTYQIKVTNTGTQTETDLRLVCVLPDKLQLVSIAGPTSAGQRHQEVLFEPLPRLAARAEVIYKVTCRATASGVAHFKAQLTSTLLVEPVQKVEPTRVYAD